MFNLTDHTITGQETVSFQQLISEHCALIDPHVTTIGVYIMVYYVIINILFPIVKKTISQNPIVAVTSMLTGSFKGSKWAEYFDMFKDILELCLFAMGVYMVYSGYLQGHLKTAHIIWLSIVGLIVLSTVIKKLTLRFKGGNKGTDTEQ